VFLVFLVFLIFLVFLVFCVFDKIKFDKEFIISRAMSSPTLFWVPSPHRYPAIVENDVLPLATPDQWFHELAAVCTINGVQVRATVRSVSVFDEDTSESRDVPCTFPGRCFDCKLNNKSLCFCFWGQNTSDVDENDVLSVELVARLKNWRGYLELVKGDTTTPQTIFPDMDVMFPPSSLKRVPQQHMIPPVPPLLMEEPFSTIIPANVFNDFLCVRQCVTIKKIGHTVLAKPFTWCESFQTVAVRESLGAALMYEDDEGVRLLGDEEGRLAVKGMMTALYKEWESVACTSKCRQPKGRCAICKNLRSTLKKIYKEGVRSSVNGLIQSMVINKEGIFAGAPTITAGFTHHEDKYCRIVKVWSEA
jgi:hypothetical protein